MGVGRQGFCFTTAGCQGTVEENEKGLLLESVLGGHECILAMEIGRSVCEDCS